MAPSGVQICGLSVSGAMLNLLSAVWLGRARFRVYVAAFLGIATECLWRSELRHADKYTHKSEELGCGFLKSFHRRRHEC